MKNYLRMKTFLMICLASLVAANPATAQNESFKVFLVGDAGEHAKTGKTLLNVQKQLLANPNSVVIFMGDNCYKSALEGIFPYGFKGFDSSKLAQNKVRAQMDILTGYKGYAYFIPGNHDWWNITDEETGAKKLKMEESFIEANLRKNPTIANPDNTFLPRNGEPGPDFVDLNQGRLRIIFLDTYRLILTDYKKKQTEEFPLEKIFYQRLDSLVKDAKRENKKLIVTGHHTLHAKGPNSKPLKNPNLFGRIKASNSSFPASSRMSSRIRTILEQYPGSYYACGHVHSLQYFLPEDSIHYIVSGAGSKTVFVPAKDIKRNQPGKGAEYLLWNSEGFFEVDFSEDQEKIYLYYDFGEYKCEIQ